MQILDINSKSNEALEKEHDWVQRAFPTTKASSVAGRTWQLTDADVLELRKDPQLREKMERNMARFLNFMKSDPRAVTRGFNHNYQRVTRVLESLRTLGFPALARQFHVSLVKAFAERGLALPDSDRRYWQPALKSSPSLAAVIPRTGLPPRADVPEIIGIGLGESARFVARALSGEAMPGDVKSIQMKASEAVISPAGQERAALYIDPFVGIEGSARAKMRSEYNGHSLYLDAELE